MRPGLGVIAAMPAEAASWALRESRWPLVCAGVGRAAAVRNAEALIASGVTGLVSWGTAGALAPDLAPGRLALYVRCVDAMSGEIFDTDSSLRARVRDCLRTMVPVLCDGLTSERPVTSVTDKRALRAQFGCSAVDMESSAIAAVARAHRLPFLVIRTIVDPAQFALPASALIGLEAHEHAVGRVVGALLRHPDELGALLKLAWWYRRALKVLRTASCLMENVDCSAHSAEGL